MLASTSIDGTAILWNIHSGGKIYTMAQVNGDSIRVCRLTIKPSVTVAYRQVNFVSYHLRFTPDSTILATAGDNGAICIWDLIRRSLIRYDIIE